MSGMTAMPFVYTFLQKLSGDVTRYVGASGQYYFSIDVVLDFSIAAVFFNEIAVSNKMFLSAKCTFEFTRCGACEGRRCAGMATINNSNDTLCEFREYCSELFGFDDGVESKGDGRRCSGRKNGRGRVCTMENEASGGVDVRDRIRIVSKVINKL